MCVTRPFEVIGHIMKEAKMDALGHDEGICHVGKAVMDALLKYVCN